MEYSDYAKLRDLQGFTDYRISKMAKITPSTFSDWKSGRCKPKNDKLEKIRHALNLSMFEFYGDNLTDAADMILDSFSMNEMSKRSAEVLDSPYIKMAKRIESLPADKYKALENYLAFLEQN